MTICPAHGRVGYSTYAHGRVGYSTYAHGRVGYSTYAHANRAWSGQIAASLLSYGQPLLLRNGPDLRLARFAHFA